MALDEAGVQLIAQGVAAYVSDMNKADQSTTGFYKTLGSSDKSASAFQEVMTGALRHVGAALVEFAAQGVKAIGGFLKDSVGLAGEFESGMLNFQAVAGKDVDAKGLEQFRDLFLDIGKRLPVSTSEVQQAATEMVKGGIDPAIIAAGGLERNIQFAAAAMDGDLVKAAEISSKVLGGWTDATATAEQKTEFLTMATDLMSKAANASATDVEGLSRGIFNAQGIAKTAGVGFGDLTTTLALLAPRFASSSEAGNSLKNMIARLQPTTKPATEAMEALGLFTEEAGSSFYDAQGNFVGFQQASQLLQDSLKGLTKEEKAAALQQIFGNDAMSAAAALADGGSLAYGNMADAMDKANGVAETAALKQAGFETSLDNAKGSVEALQITIGSALLPILGQLLDGYIAPAVNALTDFASALFGDDEAFAKLSPTMQGIASVIDVLVADVQEIVGAFTDAGGSSIEFAEAIGGLATDLGLPGDLIQDLVGGVQDLIKWFGEGGASSAALDSAVVDLSDTWENAQGVIEDVAGGYMAVAQAVLPVVAKFVDDHGTEISAFFQTAWNDIIQIVNLALEVYRSVVPPILHAIADFINAHGSEIQKILSGAWNMITSIITGALETIKGVLKLALDLIHGDWDKAWKDVQAIGKAQWDAITGAFKGFLDVIAGLFDTSIADIIKTWENNWNSMVDIVQRIDWSAIGTSIVAGIRSGISNSWDGFVSWVLGLLSGLEDDVKAFFGIKSPSQMFADFGQMLVLGLMQGVENTWPEMTNLIGGLSADLVDEMENIGRAMNDAIAGGFGATASIDRQIAKNLDDVSKIEDAFQQKIVGQDLDAQLKKAQELFADPKAQADYFKMASAHEFELLKIRQQIADATTDEDKARLNQQLILISRAQDAELDQFYKKQQGATSPAQDIANQINDVIAALSGLSLTDDQIAIVNLLGSMYNQIANPSSVPTNPAYTGATTSYNQSTTVNMPVYTNNSPRAIHDSMAIAGAALL